MYLRTEDVKCDVKVTDGFRSHMDAFSGHWDTPSIQMDTLMPENRKEIVRQEKPPDSSSGDTREHPDESNSLRHHRDVLTIRMNTFGIVTGYSRN